MLKEIVGLIPVKGSSDRVPMKNLRKFGNSSLYELKLSQLSRAEGFKEIIVSSEEESILSIAEKKGFGTHKRNPKYSTSDIPMSEVYSYIASEIEGENIAWINVTNPLAEGHIYTNAIKLFNELDKKYDCLLSANNLQENVFYKGIPVNFKPSPWPRSQDLQGCCTLPFVINILLHSCTMYVLIINTLPITESLLLLLIKQKELVFFLSVSWFCFFFFL